jgi:hypothetical protein
MSLARKIKRKQEQKVKKQMRKKSKEIEQKLSTMPKSCDECDTPFDRDDTASLSKWRIAVYEDGPVHLVCPDCIPDDIEAQTGEGLR